MKEKRNENRKDFSYYMQLTDATTKTLVGHLSDISSGGFKLDSDKKIPNNKDFHFRLDLTKDISDKKFMVFRARSKWCHTDPIDPFVYNVGFHIIDMHPEDLDIFVRVVNLYGRKKSKNKGTSPLSRRSNKW